MGEGMEKTNPEKTIEKWEASLKAYEGALTLDPADADAAYNQAYVKKKLEALKKKQEENKKDCSCQNKDNKEQNKGSNKDQNKDPQGQNRDQRGKQDSQKTDNPKNNAQQNPQQAGSQDANKGNEDEGPSQGGKTGDPQKDADQQKDKRKDSASGPDDTQDGKDSKDRAQASPDKTRGSTADRSDSANAGTKADQMRSENPEETRPVQDVGKERRPGQMTEEQAKALLDSLKGDEKRVPVIAGNRDQETGGQKKERRDW